MVGSGEWYTRWKWNWRMVLLGEVWVWGRYGLLVWDIELRRTCSLNTTYSCIYTHSAYVFTIADAFSIQHDMT